MGEILTNTGIFLLGAWIGSCVTAVILLLGWLAYDYKVRTPYPKWDDPWKGTEE